MTDPITLKLGLSKDHWGNFYAYTVQNGYVTLDRLEWMAGRNYSVVYENRVVYKFGSSEKSVLSWVNGGQKYRLTKDNSEEERHALVIDLDQNMGIKNLDKNTSVAPPSPVDGIEPAPASVATETMEVPVIWDTENFDTSKPGSFTLSGNLRVGTPPYNTSKAITFNSSAAGPLRKIRHRNRSTN
nr:Ig-like domain-containing protein [Peptoniphilus ivorii]